MKILSNVSLLLIISLIFVTLSACSTGGDVSSSQSSTTSESKVESESDNSFPKTIVGSWDCKGREYSLIFFEDGNLEYHSSIQTETGTYTYNPSNGEFELTYTYMPEGFNKQSGFIREEGTIYIEKNEEIDTLVSVEQISYKEPVLANPIVGFWDNAEIRTTMIFGEDGTYELREEDSIEYGSYVVDEANNTFTLLRPSGEERGGNYDETVLYINGFGGYFYTTLSPGFGLTQETTPDSSALQQSYPSTIVGPWDNNDAEFSISFYESGRFILASIWSTQSGTYTYNSTTGEISLTSESNPIEYSVKYGYVNELGQINLNEGTESGIYHQSTNALYTEGFRQNMINNAWNNHEHAWSLEFSDEGAYQILSNHNSESTGTFEVNNSSGDFVLTDLSGNLITGHFRENIIILDGLSGTGEFYSHSDALYNGVIDSGA